MLGSEEFLYSLRKVLLALVIFSVAFTLVPTVEVVNAWATCTGDECEGKNPNSTGCDVSASTSGVIIGSGFRTELRRSLVCPTKWARTINQSDVMVFAAAKMLIHNSTHKVSSGPINPGKQVYTTMHYPTTNTQYCGKTAGIPIPLNFSSPCAGPA